MSHWLPLELSRHGVPLAPKLVQMLDEHFSHRTERRGCGFTQATRVLAEYINTERSVLEATDLSIFSGICIQSVDAAARYWQSQGRLAGWRRMELEEGRAEEPAPFHRLRRELVLRRDALQSAGRGAMTQGSRLLLQLIAGIIDGGKVGNIGLPSTAIKPNIGSCSQAEEFFLEIAHGRVRRGGSVNVVVDPHGTPLLIEKMNLGESHSAISLEVVELNDVELPPGSLFALTHAPHAAAAPYSSHGRRLSIGHIEGVRFLRLTTLCVSPEVRLETFSAQVESQLRSNMISPLSTTLEHLRTFARHFLEKAA